jgi:hypothetical protein
MMNITAACAAGVVFVILTWRLESCTFKGQSISLVEMTMQYILNIGH